MDGKVRNERLKSPREGANILSILTFSWVLRIFLVGRRRDLEIEDLYQPLKQHTSSRLGVRAENEWEKECKAYNKRLESVKDKGGKCSSEEKVKGPSLAKVIVRCFGLKLMTYGLFFGIVEIVLGILQPLCLFQLLQYFNSTGITKDEAFLYAGGIILCTAIMTFVAHPYLMGTLHMGMKIRVACCSLIYRKSLRLSRTALGDTTVGQAVNLLSNDVNRFEVAAVMMHYLWIGPLQTVIVTYFMYREVGVSAFIGVASLLMFIPLQGYLGKRSSKLRFRTAHRTDERVRLTNEILTGIQAIKMYTWEKPFSALIDKARRKEIDVIRAMSYIRGILSFFMVFVTRMSLFITLVAYVLYERKITAAKVFMLTAYYNVLRDTMTLFLPEAIAQVAEAIVSIKRLETFMLYGEIEPARIANKSANSHINGKEEKKKVNNVTKKENTANTCEDENVIENCRGENASLMSLEDVCAKWVEQEEENTLRNINIKVKAGELIAIVGQVGSGKSSLLNVILKELPLQSGTIQINGSVAYACQEPWLFAGSIRQNILFGRAMDQMRYDRVVRVCQLKRDFSLLPYGDKSIVGERGISLSGGQRARINFARAVYAETDIYLFDDPLSAVDTHVGKHMFEECIDKYLRGKTRILVTHQLQYLRHVERIIVLKDGAIEAEGTYDELGSMGIDFGRLLETRTQTEEQKVVTAPPSRSTSRNDSITSLSSNVTTDTTKELEPDEVAEERTVGKISGKVYGNYFKAGGNYCITLMVGLLCVMSQLVASGSDVFIAQWVNMEERFVNETADGIVMDWQGWPSREACIYIYSGLTLLIIGVTIMRSYAFFWTCMRASINLHDRMFRSISRATMRFFNNNSSGRILNRFSKDTGAVDEVLPQTLIDCVQIGLHLVGIIVVVSIANPWLLIPTIVIGFIFYFLRVFYLSTSRSVKRLEGITRSPVFTHLSATLQGLPTIRAFGAEEILTKEFDQHQDLHSGAWFIFIGSSRAFGFWLDIFCMIYMMLVTLSFLAIDESGPGSMQGGNVGLAITQSLGLMGMFQWGIRQSAELENQMTSVERMLEYSKVESEPPLESTPDRKPKDNWPQEGKIEFKNLSLRYAPLDPPVLKNLSFVVQPKEKIGIVGRTGAGKSSLIQSLFRLAEVEGVIEIDGVDTSQLGLHDLRSKISIIPQEPFLFSGSMRSNLDPFESYADDLLWRALEEVELKEMGLHANVSEGGSNLSVGQKQLVCLARAIVKNNPILVLDEATANVDPRTDELIQRTIRRKFERCTVLTIAHRLNTVMDSDRILVMDAGLAVEFDRPHLLLQKETSYLKSMVNETGKAMAEALTNVARQTYFKETTTSS